MGLYQKLSDVSLEDIQLNDAGIAFKTASDILGNSVFDVERTIGLELPNEIGGGAFKDENGNFQYVLWAKTQKDNSEQASATFNFPLSWNMNFVEIKDWTYSRHGRSTVIPASTITLSGAPQFFSAAEMPAVQNIEVNCFPNPFERHFHLSFQLHEERLVKIELLNAKGVFTLALLESQNLDAGIYQLNFEMKDLPEGIYLLKMELGARLIVKKIIKH